MENYTAGGGNTRAEKRSQQQSRSATSDSVDVNMSEARGKEDRGEEVRSVCSAGGGAGETLVSGNLH